MQIYIAKSGQQTGPFSLEQLQSMLGSGMVTLTDSAWHEGLESWLPLHQVLNVSPPLPIASQPPPLPDTGTRAPRSAIAELGVVRQTNPRPLPFTSYPRKAKMFLLLLVCVAFVACCVLLIRRGEMIGWMGALFFGLGIPVFLIQLYPGSSFLTVSDEGIEYCSLFRRHRIRWSDISEFGTYSIRRHGLPVSTLVGFNFSVEYQRSPETRAVSRALTGFEGGLPDTYGFKPDELAELLAFYHSQRMAR